MRLKEFAVPIAVLLVSALALLPSVAYAYNDYNELWVKYSGTIPQPKQPTSAMRDNAQLQ